MKEVKLDPLLEGWLGGNQVEKGERADQPEEVLGLMKWCHSVGLVGAQAQEKLLGNAGSAVIRDYSLEDVSCDQEGTTQVWSMKKSRSLNLILCCRALMCLQGQRTVLQSCFCPCWLRVREELGHLINLSVFMEHFLWVFLQQEGFQRPIIQSHGNLSQMAPGWPLTQPLIQHSLSE